MSPQGRDPLLFLLPPHPYPHPLIFYPPHSLIFYLARSHVSRGLRRWYSSVWVENEIYFLPATKKECRWMDVIAYCLCHIVQPFSKIFCKVHDYAEQEMKYLNDNAFQLVLTILMEHSNGNTNRDRRNYSHHLLPLSDELQFGALFIFIAWDKSKGTKNFFSCKDCHVKYCEGENMFIKSWGRSLHLCKFVCLLWLVGLFLDYIPEMLLMHMSLDMIQGFMPTQLHIQETQQINQWISEHI